MSLAAEHVEYISDDVTIHTMPNFEYHVYAKNPHDGWKWHLWKKLHYQSMARHAACERAAELRQIRIQGRKG